MIIIIDKSKTRVHMTYLVFFFFVVFFYIYNQNWLFLAHPSFSFFKKESNSKILINEVLAKLDSTN